MLNGTIKTLGFTTPCAHAFVALMLQRQKTGTALEVFGQLINYVLVGTDTEWRVGKIYERQDWVIDSRS